MEKSKLKGNYDAYGNKGACWSNKVHITKTNSFSGTTLCGTPMLASNYARIWDEKEIGCPDCLRIYNEKQQRKLMKKIMQYKQNPLTGDWLCWIPKTAHAYYYNTEKNAKEFADNVNRAFEKGELHIDKDGNVNKPLNPTNHAKR